MISRRVAVRIGLALPLAGLAVASAILFGRLKSLYYLRTFGVDAGLVESSVGASLFESWFVIQNVILFSMLLWIAVKTRLAWVAAVCVLHGLLPILSHYAFALEPSIVSDTLIRYRHSLMKLVPFLVIGIVWLTHREHRATLRDPDWPWGRPAFGLFVVVVLFWGISTAKHFGSYDANRAMRWPDAHLSRVSIDRATLDELGFEQTDPDGLYLVAATDLKLILWDRTGSSSDTTRVLDISRSALVGYELRGPRQVQPGSQFL